MTGLRVAIKKIGGGIDGEWEGSEMWRIRRRWEGGGVREFIGREGSEDIINVRIVDRRQCLNFCL